MLPLAENSKALKTLKVLQSQIWEMACSQSAIEEAMDLQHLFMIFADRWQAVLASDLSFGGLKSDLGGLAHWGAHFSTLLISSCKLSTGICIYSSVHSGSGRLQRKGEHVTCCAATGIDTFLFKNWHYIVSAGLEAMIRLFSLIILELWLF